MSRAHVSYTDRGDGRRFDGVDVTEPAEGFYHVRLRSGAVRRGVQLVYGPPIDPETGEVMDRSWRWMAYLDDGSLVPMDDVWPVCAGSPITEAEYRAYVDRAEWAKRAAPDSAYANPRKRIDPLSPNSPLPF